MRRRWIIGGAVLLVAFGAVYTGYWYWLAQTFQQNLALWVDQQRATGYRMTYTAGDPHGFPLAVAIALRDVVIESPPDQAPWRLSTTSKTLNLAPWAPLTLRIGNSGDPQPCNLTWSAGGRAYELALKGLDARLRISTEGEPPNIAITAASFDVREDGKAIAEAAQASGGVDFLPAVSHAEDSIEFRLSARNVTIQGADSRNEQTRDLLLAGQVKGPVPIGPLPAALAAWSRDGGRIELTAFNATWEAATELSGDGTVALDGQLQPVAAFSAVVRGYNEAIDTVVARGLMTPAQGTAAKFWLAARAEKDERGLKVKLPLTIQDGFLSMGPIKLAQVPRISWD